MCGSYYTKNRALGISDRRRKTRNSVRKGNTLKSDGVEECLRNDIPTNRTWQGTILHTLDNFR